MVNLEKAVVKGFERGVFSIAILLLALAGCGGGGGGGGSSTATNSLLPPAPTGVTATAFDSYVLINGNVVSGVTAVNIYWATAPGVTKQTGNKIVVGSSPQAHTGLTNGTTYYYVTTAVNQYGEGSESPQVSATPVAVIAAADPLFADQWNLKNTSQVSAASAAVVAKAGEDINVQPAWTARPNKGAGIRIAIVDDGIEIGHEDLASNIAPNGTSYNYITLSTDPTNDPADTLSGHGTKCAGIAAARDQNGLGGTGVAPRANLVGYNLLQQLTASNEADAMTRGVANVHVSSNSWGSPDSTGNVFASNATWQAAVNAGLSTGRGGLGTVYTWAAGNGAPLDNSNYDGQANYRGVIAVGAVNHLGAKSSYSEQGANLWVSAPGGEFCDTLAITTVDRTGALGGNTAATAGLTDYANKNYTRCMNGTSSATPTVAGVVALVLEANPNLGWRDVRNILAQTARKNDPLDPGWMLTKGTPVYNYNHKYGFGVVDANAAVTAAATWVNLPAEKTFATAVAAPALAIPDNNVTGVSNTIAVAGSLITSIEYIDITFSAADHTWPGDLKVTLTSPLGNISTLSVTHNCINTAAPTVAIKCNSYSAWRFGSAAHLGEAADGNWTLTVVDGAPVDTGTFQSWSLKFYGH